ncbi:MAG: tetratricopeptide repeat protein [Chitinophagaceae bacterium]|nr:tetratricopeptide repeat protein [Chitinophagaceae bacterium]
MLKIAARHYNSRLIVRIFLVVLLTSPLTSSGERVFDFNANCRKAYADIISLKLASGQQLLDQEKQHNPDNLIPAFLENYIDFFVLFFNEDPAEYRLRVKHLEKRLDLMDEGPTSSPFFLFTKSIIHFQWAAIKIKFGYSWDAGWAFRRSFMQIKENQVKFPDFKPNALYIGSMEVAAGTIPDGYRWLGNMLGIKGNLKEGMRKLNAFFLLNDEWSLLFRNEAAFYFCYLKYYIENDHSAVFKFIADQRLDIVNNHLFTYLAANLSINNHESAKAIRIINERNISREYLQTPVWDLELGYSKLNHLEPDAAIYFSRFLQSFKGKFYVKDALQKLSWLYYLQGNMEQAKKYRAEILKKGSTDMEADKQAQKEAKTNSWPNKELLSARLLNDGGYYQEALRVLYGKKHSDFTLPEEQTEFSYRGGRLYEDIGRIDEAIIFYKNTILLGEKRKEYFAARAALHLGNIFEKRKDLATAISWFERCLKMKDHDFKNSLDQRAKAGIARCKGE